MTRIARALLSACLLTALTPLRAQAAVSQDDLSANVSLVPLRVVLDTGKRSAEIYVINSGNAEGRYRLSFSHMDMDAFGNLTTRPAGQRAMGELFADDMLRFSPHEMTLAPGESQVVRVQLKLPADLPEGEYRAHLSAVTLPPDGGVSAHAAQGQFSVKLHPAFGISIPVIIRKGHLSATAALDHAQLSTAGARSLLVDLERQGNASIYGDFEVRFAPKSGKALDAGQMKGVAVYTPNPLRHVQIPLAPQAVGAGTFQIRFVDPETRATLAETRLEVP